MDTSNGHIITAEAANLINKRNSVMKRIRAGKNTVVMVTSRAFVKAKQIIKAKFQQDSSLRKTYVNNVSQFLMDTMPIARKDKKRADAIASEIIRIVCE